MTFDPYDMAVGERTKSSTFAAFEPVEIVRPSTVRPRSNGPRTTVWHSTTPVVFEKVTIIKAAAHSKRRP